MFEGPRDAVERLVRFAETGPKHARLERTDVLDEQPEGLTRFEVCLRGT